MNCETKLHADFATFFKSYIFQYVPLTLV